MEKYYTPALEEFHIGFEYEELSNNDMLSIRSEDHIDNIQWYKQTFDLIDIMLLEHNLRFQNIRVKYLDRDDIASLGFEHLGSGWFERGDYRIRKWIEQEVDIYLWDIDPENGAGERIFRGSIKNKSELKKLLKQLNIN